MPWRLLPLLPHHCQIRERRLELRAEGDPRASISSPAKETTNGWKVLAGIVAGAVIVLLTIVVGVSHIDGPSSPGSGNLGQNPGQ